MDIKFGVLMFKEIRERFESFRVRNITFCCSHLRRRKIMCKFSLYMETKIPIRLNIFDPEDFWKTYGRLMEDLWKTLI